MQNNTEKLHFEITINAPVEKVYKTMLDKPTYEIWTKAFDATSTFEGSWDKGSTIKFISTNGGEEGMVAEIADNIPNKFVSVRHVGQISKDGQTDFPEPGYENYTFVDKEGQTELQIDMTGLPKEMLPMFEDMWPKALAKLKEISEA